MAATEVSPTLMPPKWRLTYSMKKSKQMLEGMMPARICLKARYDLMKLIQIVRRPFLEELAPRPCSSETPQLLRDFRTFLVHCS